MCFVSLPVSQSSRIASSAAAAAASAPRSPVWLCWRRRRRRWRQAGSGFHLHIYITYMQTAHSTQHTTHNTHTYSTHNCICVCAYLRLCKTRSDMYTIVLPFQLYTNTSKKWEWYTIATSAASRDVCAGIGISVCVGVPEHTLLC